MLGSINEDIVITTDRLPLPGETVAGRDLRRSLGGKGANQAVAAARSGADVTLIAATGDDRASDGLVAQVAAYGVDIQHVRRCSGPSGTALITVDGSGEHTIVVASGANATLTPDDLGGCGIEQAVALVLSLESPMDTVLAAARLAHTAGAIVILNASPRPETLPRALLESLTTVVGNAAEVGDGSLTGLPDTVAVVTTLGAGGASLRDAAASVHVAAPQVAAVDSTGAGDAFLGAFVCARASGATSLEALRRGCAAGAITASNGERSPLISQPGSSTSSYAHLIDRVGATSGSAGGDDGDRVSPGGSHV